MDILTAIIASVTSEKAPVAGLTATTVLGFALAVYNWVSTKLMLAISQADKDADGRLDNTELEDLAILLCRQSNSVLLRNFPEGVLRRLIARLCSLRKKVIVPDK